MLQGNHALRQQKSDSAVAKGDGGLDEPNAPIRQVLERRTKRKDVDLTARQGAPDLDDASVPVHFQKLNKTRRPKKWHSTIKQ